MQIKIEESWKKHLAVEFEKPYFDTLINFVKKEYDREVVYPPRRCIFRAFDLTPFDQVKVIILGQDPYHGEGQANGLSFAVGEGIPIPPSLQNMYKEIDAEYPSTKAWANTVSRSGDLSHWAQQGVLLLNATLTVRAHKPGSHQHQGWEEFTDAVIAALSRERENIVFVLWGNYAKNKGQHIDRSKHLVLEAAHPSPFSAYNGFFGCNHFKLANEYLLKHHKKPIDWL